MSSNLSAPSDAHNPNDNAHSNGSNWVYLVDSSIYIFRAWQTLPASVVNSKGEPFNAVTGFAETLTDIIKTQQPNWLCAAFDSRNREAIRYRIHPDYKANRSPSPENLQHQFAQCQAVCKALGIPNLVHKDIEADDIIGHLAQLAQERAHPVSIVSADKDLVQFIRQNDVFWNYARKTKSHYPQLRKRFGVKPEQMADLLALCGDKTDNIPGIPGVGEATAARILTKWENLDGVFANIEGVATMRFRGAAQISVLLSEYEQQVRMARRLTGLVTADELPTSIESIQYNPRKHEDCVTDLMGIGFFEADAVRIAKSINPSSL